MKRIYNSPEVKVHKLEILSLLISASQEEGAESIYNGGINPNPNAQDNHPGGGKMEEATDEDWINQG